MKYKTVLITGGAGFIGSNLAIFFKRKYPMFEIIALDSLKRRGSELNLIRLKENGIDFIHGDIRCPEDLVLNKKIDLMIECSAEPSVLSGLSDNPLYIMNTNLAGTINCLELARKDQADIIFLSTSRVYPYGPINDIKIKETHSRFEWVSQQKIMGWSKDGINTNFTTQGPKTFYGATKLASELLLQEYIANYGIKGVINRCGVIAGPWQFGKVDQGIFTFWMLAHYFKRSVKYIGFGGQGKQVRDFLHINDLFELIDLQARSLDKINGEIYNVGGSRKNSLSIFETTKLCEEITGNRLKIASEKTTRPGDIKVYITDNHKVNKELKWHPKIDARNTFLDIFKWIQRNESGLKRLS